MIIYGHNHFKMRNFTPTELGLPPEYNAYNIEVRQRYVHIFWIPLFPIGKLWGLRKHADGELYEIPASLKQQIQEQVRVPAVSIWGFSGLLLAALVMMIAGISNYVKQVQAENMMQEHYKDEYNMKMSYVNDPRQGDHYTFLSSSYDSKYFVVKTVEPNKLELEELDESYDQPKTFWIARADVKNFLSETYDPSFKGASLPGMSDGPYELQSVERGTYEEQPVLLRPGEEGKSASGAQEAKSK